MDGATHGMTGTNEAVRRPHPGNGGDADESLGRERRRAKMKALENGYRKREILVVCLYAVCLCLSLSHFVHNAWYQILPPDTPLLPKMYAPDAYRVAIPALTRAAMVLSGVHQLAWIYAGLDFVWSLCTVGCLYLLTVEAPPLRSQGERVARLAILLTSLTLTWNWIVPWQRPETTPSCCFLAFALLCLLRADGSQRRGIWTAALLLAACWQAFVRADVAFVFGAALALTSLASKNASARRQAGLLQGAAIAAIGGGVQAYLQLVRYPHRSYDPRMPMLSFRHNLGGNNLTTAILALLPFLLTALLLPRAKQLSRSAVLAMAAAALYLPLWFTVALIAEVRVYVPFLTILCLPVAEAVSGYLLQYSPA